MSCQECNDVAIDILLVFKAMRAISRPSFSFFGTVTKLQDIYEVGQVVVCATSDVVRVFNGIGGIYGKF